MPSETYLNHPTFGLLYSICAFERERALFTTLYAQRLFFIVTQNQEGIKFEPITRNEARIIAETVLRTLRREGTQKDYDRLHTIHRQTF
ncbi:MAG: PipX family protein [Thermosynechococcaceae cyanobacterium]